MTAGDWLNETKRHLLFFAKLLGTITIDASFLACWAGIQWGVDRVLEVFPPAGINTSVYEFLQLSFAHAGGLVAAVAMRDHPAASHGGC